MKLLNSYSLQLVLLFSTFAIAIAVYWSYVNGKILAYGDAEAHLNLSKRVVDSLTPGMSQLGGVWLPLPHILMIPFVWNDTLWQTGLAGSIVSAVAFVWSSIVLYKLAYLVTNNKIASLFAPLIWITNPNSLYLSTTPMSEIVLFASVTTAMYFLIKWIKEPTILNLTLSGVFSFAATLTRYDGWFLVCIGSAVVFLLSYIKHRSFTKTLGVVVVYALPAFFGIFLWLLWNLLIFGDFTYFANSEYGSKAQQMWFYERGYLPTYNNLWLSFIYYLTDTWLVIGHVTILALLGLVAFLTVTVSKKRVSLAELSILLLLFPLGFYTVSLFTGQASLILPTFAEPWYQWETSNVRYGVQMLLPVAIFVSVLMKYVPNIVKIVCALFIVFQLYYFTNIQSPIVYVDGTRGLSSQAISKGEDAYPVEKWVSENYDGGYVIMDDYRRPISPVASKIPMNMFINVGTKPYWEESLDNPTKYADWIILQKAETDAFWKNLQNKDILQDHFSVVFNEGNIWVYKKDSQNSDFVTKKGQKLFIGENEFMFYGANIYDLARMDIDKAIILLDQINSLGINTIRIWGFNKEGTLSYSDFENLDKIIAEVADRNMKLVIVLANQWDDYGGIPDDFYTNTESKNNYKAYVKDVVSRYSDNPAVMAWELINEPRMEGEMTGEVVYKWIEEMAEYVQLLDNKHLVSVGTEGFMHEDNDLPYSENHGADFRMICNSPAIDICSGHLYPKYFSSNTVSDEQIEQLLDRWQNISEEANKPFYIGEVGYDMSNIVSSYAGRELFYNRVITIAKRKNINGLLIWNIAPVDDMFFSISPFNERNRRFISNLSSN